MKFEKVFLNQIIKLFWHRNESEKGKEKKSKQHKLLTTKKQKAKIQTDSQILEQILTNVRIK